MASLVMEIWNYGPQISFLSDGSLYTDDGYDVVVYEKGFCMENFVERTQNFSIFSALICTNNTSSFNGSSPNYKEEVKFFVLTLLSSIKARCDTPFQHASTALRRVFSVWKRNAMRFQPLEIFLLKSFWLAANQRFLAFQASAVGQMIVFENALHCGRRMRKRHV
jgi:hypothetical protein